MCYTNLSIYQVEDNAFGQKPMLASCSVLEVSLLVVTTPPRLHNHHSLLCLEQHQNVFHENTNLR